MKHPCSLAGSGLTEGVEGGGSGCNGIVGVSFVKFRAGAYELSRRGICVLVSGFKIDKGPEVVPWTSNVFPDLALIHSPLT